MEEWIYSIMDSFGYAGIFLLIAVENLFPPIPSEVILTLGGFMTTTTSMTVLGAIIAATAGSVAGALCLYGVGRILSAERLGEIVTRYGKVLRLKPEDIKKAEAWFARHGTWTVLLGRLVPLIRSLISIPAGSAKMNLVSFLLLTTLGSLIWNTALVYVGSILGNSWDSVLAYMDMYSNVVYAMLALGMLVFAAVFYRYRIAKKKVTRTDG
ncbi:DedA family protein [Paenibacillus sp. YN15]|uniref:DedA family protein n=1 Tax=Paenibacillus sp. YN15 TaxID=1742774 RepID=UPI000DCCB525|nr:DedA family protein [Paenibacillus sp. YN15]RAV01962.1 DedA family protein [Paenibacillus sp. YN15]